VAQVEEVQDRGRFMYEPQQPDLRQEGISHRCEESVEHSDATEATQQPARVAEQSQVSLLRQGKSRLTLMLISRCASDRNVPREVTKVPLARSNRETRKTKLARLYRCRAVLLLLSRMRSLSQSREKLRQSQRTDNESQFQAGFKEPRARARARAHFSGFSCSIIAGTALMHAAFRRGSPVLSGRYLSREMENSCRRDFVLCPLIEQR